MIRVLFRKEIKELFSFFMYDSKKKEKRSKSSLIGYIVLYAMLFIVIAVSFFGMASLFAASIAQTENGKWIYFAILSLLAILLGTVIDAFSAYTLLYKSKDNDILLSLPIKSGDLLLSKMIGLYLLAFVYTAMVYVPMCLAFHVFVGFDLVALLIEILLFMVVPFVVVVLSCLLGYIVALFSKLTNGNKFFTVGVSLILFGLYYYVMMRMNSLLNMIVASSDIIASNIRRFLFPIYHLGRALSGDVISLLIFVGITVLVFGICYYLLSISYYSLALNSTAYKKISFKKEFIRSSSISKALYKKEIKRYTSSTIYMLNTGIGIVMMLGLTVFAIIKKSGIDEFIYYMGLEGMDMSKYVPLGLLLMGVFICSTNAISAPSISLEGNTIWILQSLPLKPYEILSAKRKLHVVLNVVPTFISVVVIGLVYKLDIIAMVMLFITMVVYIVFHSMFGLILNLKKPVLEWMNEQVPVKQSMSVMIALFGGYLIALLMLGLFLLIGKYVEIGIYLLIISLILIAISIIMDKWLRTKGSEIFANL